MQVHADVVRGAWQPRLEMLVIMEAHLAFEQFDIHVFWAISLALAMLRVRARASLMRGPWGRAIACSIKASDYSARSAVELTDELLAPSDLHVFTMLSTSSPYTRLARI